MKEYNEFHGEIEPKNVGKRLREIVASKEDFIIITGYGSTSGICKSKEAAIKALRKLYKEGLIKGFITGDNVNNIPKTKDEMEFKAKFREKIKNQDHAGNPGAIFVFVKD